MNITQRQNAGGAPYSMIALFVFEVTNPTILSAIPPVCLSLGAVNSILCPRCAAKSKTSSDVYADSESIRINLGFNGSGFAASYTGQDGLRFHSLVNDFTTSSADLVLVKLQ